MSDKPSEPKAELLPCPFCEWREVKVFGPSRENGGYHAECRRCLASGPHTGKAEAARRWNERAGDDLKKFRDRLAEEEESSLFEAQRADKAEARIAELEAAQEWRPANRSPEDGRYVIGWTKAGKLIHLFAVALSEDNWDEFVWFQVTPRNNQVQRSDITHWCEEPKGPTE